MSMLRFTYPALLTYKYFAPLCAGEYVLRRHSKREDRLVVLHAMRQRGRAVVSRHTLSNAIAGASLMARRSCHGHGQPGLTQMWWLCIFKDAVGLVQTKAAAMTEFPRVQSHGTPPH